MLSVDKLTTCNSSSVMSSVYLYIITLCNVTCCNVTLFILTFKTPLQPGVLHLLVEFTRSKNDQMWDVSPTNPMLLVGSSTRIFLLTGVGKKV